MLQCFDRRQILFSSMWHLPRLSQGRTQGRPKCALGWLQKLTHVLVFTAWPNAPAACSIIGTLYNCLWQWWWYISYSAVSLTGNLRVFLSVKARFPLAELTGRQHGSCWRVMMETGHPLTRAVNSGSGNRALPSVLIVASMLLLSSTAGHNTRTLSASIGWSTCHPLLYIHKIRRYRSIYRHDRLLSAVAINR